MDAFEAIISTVLDQKGYWVRRAFKVELTKSDKRKIGRTSNPRWEIDLLAYHASRNELLTVECKSYLDSKGVRFSELTKMEKDSRYKPFSDTKLRKIVFHRLKTQLAKKKWFRRAPQIRLALAAGHIPTEADRAKLRKHFTKKGGSFLTTWRLGMLWRGWRRPVMKMTLLQSLRRYCCESDRRRNDPTLLC